MTKIDSTFTVQETEREVITSALSMLLDGGGKAD